MLKDDEGYRYELDRFHTFETPAEVFAYIIKDRNDKYTSLLNMYDDTIFDAVEQSALGIYNKACADFHETIDAEKPTIRRKFRERVLKESE